LSSKLRTVRGESGGRGKFHKKGESTGVKKTGQCRGGGEKRASSKAREFKLLERIFHKLGLLSRESEGGRGGMGRNEGGKVEKS